MDIHGRLGMKKTIFLLSFAFISAGVFGMTNVCVDRSSSNSLVDLISIEKNNLETKPVLQSLRQSANSRSSYSRQRLSKQKNQNQKKIMNSNRKRFVRHMYGIKESDLVFIINKMRNAKKDLSNIKVMQSKSLKENQILEITKGNKINDYNRGLLSSEGISINYNTYLRDVKNIIFKRYISEIERINGRRINDNNLVFDLKNKPQQEIKKKYGYKFTYIDNLERYITHWECLTDDQKKLFKTTVNNKTMQIKDILSSITSSSTHVINEKFRKFLFVLTSTREGVRKKYDLSKKGVYRLKLMEGVGQVNVKKERKWKPLYCCQV